MFQFTFFKRHTRREKDRKEFCYKNIINDIHHIINKHIDEVRQTLIEYSDLNVMESVLRKLKKHVLKSRTIFISFGILNENKHPVPCYQFCTILPFSLMSGTLFFLVFFTKSTKTCKNQPFASIYLFFFPFHNKTRNPGAIKTVD